MTDRFHQLTLLLDMLYQEAWDASEEEISDCLCERLAVLEEELSIVKALEKREAIREDALCALEEVTDAASWNFWAKRAAV